MNNVYAAGVMVLGIVTNGLTGCGDEGPIQKPIPEPSAIESVISEEEKPQESLPGVSLDAEQPEASSEREEQPEASEAENQTLPDKTIEEAGEESKAQEPDIRATEDPAERQAVLAALGAEGPARPASLPASAPAQPAENSSVVGYNDRKSWWFKRNADHIPPSSQMEINISQYGAYYLGDTDHKNIYLTFDEGYENGYTSQILDILKENNIKAAFFVTKSYIESEPELVKRMVEEGHIVGNHSDTHPDMTTISDEQIVQELTACANAFEELTGMKMPHYFRPPEGVYSIRTLEKTQEAGYNTIFWSYAYQDWDRNNQPGRQKALDMFLTNYHNGGIYLLHAVSQSNTEALDEILKTMISYGYEFKTLDELP